MGILGLMKSGAGVPVLPGLLGNLYGDLKGEESELEKIEKLRRMGLLGSLPNMQESLLSKVMR